MRVFLEECLVKNKELHNRKAFLEERWNAQDTQEDSDNYQNS